MAGILPAQAIMIKGYSRRACTQDVQMQKDMLLTCAVPPLRGPTLLVADMQAPHAMTSAG